MTTTAFAFVHSFRSLLPGLTASSFSSNSHLSSTKLSSTRRPSRANHVSRWRMNMPPGPSSSTPTPTPPTPESDSDPIPSIDDAYTIDTEALVARAKDAFSDVSDRPLYYSKIAGYAAGAIVLLTVLRAIVAAIDALPVLPATLELVGLGYAAWFVWRYVLFRDTRTELVDEIDDFLGRTRPGGKSGE